MTESSSRKRVAVSALCRSAADGLICVGKDLRREGFARAAKCFDQGDLAGNVVPHIAGGKARTSIAPMAKRPI